MQNKAYKRALIDKHLSAEWDLTADSLAESPVFDLLEQGGPNVYTQFQMELTTAQDKDVSVTMTVKCCDTMDGEFIDSGIVLKNELRSDGEDMSFQDCNSHVKRYIKVVPAVTIKEESDASAQGKATFWIAM